MAFSLLLVALMMAGVTTVT